ncbi:MAG: TPM domain-containing protein [Pseudomonadota bacterium]|nr:TPM domain-containing protein [Pseudomonadota bacterium]
MKLHWLPLIWLLAAPAAAQDFPALSGRVVDGADLLTPPDEAALTQKLAALDQASSRQLVVATVPDLQGYEIEDYGYRLGRAWQIGQTEANNGTILLVAPNDRKVRIEVGYGLEPILTDALSSLIIQNDILPRFRENDYPGGIVAGTDAIIAQLQAPPEVAEQRALEAQAQAQQQQARGGEGGSVFPFIVWGMILLFVLMSFGRKGGGRRGGRRYGGSNLPIILWAIANEMGRSGGGGGGFGGFGGGGGGGFSGGGGSFGGGGASGGW